jgi:hypothetical protein
LDLRGKRTKIPQRHRNQKEKGPPFAFLSCKIAGERYSSGEMKSTILALCALCLLAPVTIFAHCQVPCGIYTDDNVLNQLLESDFKTVEKASIQIIELSKDPATNAHQLTRWIINKESHAQAIQETITNYFLAQRLKLTESDTSKDTYLKKLTTCHKVIVAAMKCKQSTDPTAVKMLHDQLHVLQELFGSKKEN